MERGGGAYEQKRRERDIETREKEKDGRSKEIREGNGQTEGKEIVAIAIMRVKEREEFYGKIDPYQE